MLLRFEPPITGMAYLRDRVADIAALIPRDKPVVYLDYPVYINIGDLLIEWGTERFFADFGYRVAQRRSAYDFDARARRRVPADATIVLQGGGNFGDLYDLHQPFREDVIAGFPNHRIVVLPQTLHFESPERLRSAARLFARHADLHVCLRDTVSLELYRRHFSNAVYLVPDMAHFLWKAPGFHGAAAESLGTLRLVRRDGEKQELGSGMADGGRGYDWIDLIGPVDLFLFRALYKMHAERRAVARGAPFAALWRRFVVRLIGNVRRVVAAHDAVATNRLHGALFGLLLGKPVTMSDNSYGKLSSYYSTWLATIPDARLLAPEGAEQRSEERVRAIAGDC